MYLWMMYALGLATGIILITTLVDLLDD